jgi:hypothetical protein
MALTPDFAYETVAVKGVEPAIGIDEGGEGW